MIADTSFLASLFMESDQNHLIAEATAKTQKDVILVPLEVLEETFTVLRYRKSLEHSLQAVRIITGDPTFYVLSPTSFGEAIELLKRTKKKLSFVDGIVLFHSLGIGSVPLAFDKDLLKEYRRLKGKGS
jgi:predicted nucleic acid-binding protein